MNGLDPGTSLRPPLEHKAREIRRWILETALKEGRGHIPPALSWVEIAVALFYGDAMQTDDRLVLSKVHGHLALDAVLADKDAKLFGVWWPGYPHICSGSLGQGLSIAAGMALANKLSGYPGRVFCVLGDAELHEGANWEAIAFAAQHRLDNLVAIIDDNAQCCADLTRDVINMEPLSAKFGAFGWNCVEVHGHDLEELKLHLSPDNSSRPRVVIAHTTKGRGISFMEGNPAWHHQTLKGEQIEIARRCLA